MLRKKTKLNKTKNFNTNETVRMLTFDQRKRISLTISDFTPDIISKQFIFIWPGCFDTAVFWIPS